MSLELLFGLALLAFLIAWIGWLIGISRGKRVPIIAGAVAVAAVGAAVVIINGQRQDQQREDFAEKITTYIGAVAEAQEEAYEADGAYKELPEDQEMVPEIFGLDGDLVTYEGGTLQENETIESTLIRPSKNEYSISGRLGDEEYELEVTRSGETVQEIRTCDVSGPVDRCVDGTWEPVGSVPPES